MTVKIIVDSTADMIPEVEHRLRESDCLICAIDAINLVESGLDRLCDRTVAVTAPAELRIRRIMNRDNISEQYARLRLSAQRPDEYYRSRCHCELTNNADSPEEFQAEALGYFTRLIEKIKEEKHHGSV